MPIVDLPIIGYFNVGRFKQFACDDASGWFIVNNPQGKKKACLYPTTGRRHINFLGQNRLIFDNQPRHIYKSNNYTYIIVDDRIYRYDIYFNEIEVTASTKLSTLSGNIFFTFLVVGSPQTALNPTFACFTDGVHMYVHNEATLSFDIVTDTKLVLNPLFIATFGNRIVVSGAGSSTFSLSEINLEGSAFDPSSCFTINHAAIFAQESGVITQMGVFLNTLYIFTEYTTGIWSNIPSTFISAGGVPSPFPWKKNTTYDWDYGLYDPNTLSIDFDRMCWLGRNRSGIVTPMVSLSGQKPVTFENEEAVDVLLQRIINFDNNSTPFMSLSADAFLYDYENTVFWRISGGIYNNTGLLDQISTQFSIEYNFKTNTWHRCIELNGERNRMQDHVFFGNRHLVTVVGDNTVYEMSGSFYTNDVRNPDQPNDNMIDSYIQYPFRYERVTPIICAGLIENFKAPGFYAEFQTNYVEIDFVWGESFIHSCGAFENAQFIIDETADGSGDPVYVVDDQSPVNDPTFMIAEQGNLPQIFSPIYCNWFKPHIELYYSDDGGISFHSADVREFSQLGVYQWRMRWYQLGCSRNRVYKLVCVSPVPIVVLGGVMEVVNVSGGAS